MKKLMECKKLLKKLNGNLDSLRYYGFKLIDTTGVSGYCWINESKRIVVKKPYLIDCSNIYSAYKVPTVFYDKIVIQPLVNTSYKAINKACKLLDIYLKDKLITHVIDYHSGNVGMYRNKPVFFDW